MPVGDCGEPTTLKRPLAECAQCGVLTAFKEALRNQLLPRDPPGFGIARWRLLQALDAAAVGRSDPHDKAK